MPEERIPTHCRRTSRIHRQGGWGGGWRGSISCWRSTSQRRPTGSASARLVYLDGAASSGDFPLSNADTFIPGKEVEILAGATNDPVTLFKGIVVRQSLKVRDQVSPATGGGMPAQGGQTDGRAAKTPIFSTRRTATSSAPCCKTPALTRMWKPPRVTHKQQVQYNCTDWDFMLMRAEANGKLVFTADDKVLVKAPVTTGAAVCTLQFGATILEMDAQIDARQQYGAVKSATWASGPARGG